MDKVNCQRGKMLALLRRFSFLTVVILNSCNVNKSAKYIDGDDLIPEQPSLVSKFSIHGVDSDNDGVRDDFELLINQKIKDEDLRKAFKNFAKVIIKGMKLTSREEAILNQIENRKSWMCVSVLSQGVLTVEEKFKIHDSILNTSERKKEYDEKARFLPTGVYSTGSINPLIELKACDFIPKRTKHIVKEAFKTNRAYCCGVESSTIDEFQAFIRNDL